MVGRVARGDAHLEALGRFTQIAELGPAPGDALPARWEQVRNTVQECAAREDEISLIDRPVCEQCGTRLGSRLEFTEINETLRDISAALAVYTERLGSVTVQEILLGHRQDEVARLLQLNAAADLSALSNVLSDQVIGFLRQFVRDSGTRRNTEG